jgi:hypothetical protein
MWGDGSGSSLGHRAIDTKFGGLTSFRVCLSSRFPRDVTARSLHVQPFCHGVETMSRNAILIDLSIVHRTIGSILAVSCCKVCVYASEVEWGWVTAMTMVVSDATVYFPIMVSFSFDGCRVLRRCCCDCAYPDGLFAHLSLLLLPGYRASLRNRKYHINQSSCPSFPS